MKYDYDTDKMKIRRLLMKRACSFDEIQLVVNFSLSKLSELIIDLEKDGLIFSIWKYEKFSKNNKPYTRMRRIYLISNSFQLSYKQGNTVSAIKICRTINSRRCKNEKRN